jgi:spore germination cell wall hydrolase CwlJ-like protein
LREQERVFFSPIQQGEAMFKAKFFTSINLLTATILFFTVVLTYSFPYHVTQDINTDVQVHMSKEMECLAKNIYYEAASESFEGKLAVAQVTINRTNSGKYPSDICGVVYQKANSNGKTVCQFSWTCMNVSVAKNEYRWDESKYIAMKALTQPIAHARIAKTQALFYHAKYVQPGWNKKHVVMQIGNHIFYTRT